MSVCVTVLLIEGLSWKYAIKIEYDGHASLELRGSLSATPFNKQCGLKFWSIKNILDVKVFGNQKWVVEHLGVGKEIFVVVVITEPFYNTV